MITTSTIALSTHKPTSLNKNQIPNSIHTKTSPHNSQLNAIQTNVESALAEKENLSGNQFVPFTASCFSGSSIYIDSTAAFLSDTIIGSTDSASTLTINSSSMVVNGDHV